jgi:hypothetical protein
MALYKRLSGEKVLLSTAKRKLSHIKIQLGVIGFLLFNAVFLSGCTRTVIGGYSESPDKEYCLYGRIYGGYGKSFLDDADKKVIVSIVKSGATEKSLLRKEYSIRGSNVDWKATWDAHTNVTVVIFEYPSGYNRWDTSKKAPLIKELRKLIYNFDSNAKTFIEKQQ